MSERLPRLERSEFQIDVINNLKSQMYNNSNTDDRLASIILLSYNSMNDLVECIPSLEKQTYANYEIIIVDNASTDDTSEFVRTNYPNISFVDAGSNLGYPAGNNLG